MHKRVLEHDIDEELTKKVKENDWEEFMDYHPCAVNEWQAAAQDCRHCGEPMQDHHYYTIEKYWDTMEIISVLRCDRKVNRVYYAKLRIYEQPTKYYRLMVTSSMYDAKELYEGKWTQ